MNTNQLSKIPVGQSKSGKYKMWAMDGKIINGREFHYFCRKVKTKPTDLTEQQITNYLSQEYMRRKNNG